MLGTALGFCAHRSNEGCGARAAELFARGKAPSPGSSLKKIQPPDSTRQPGITGVGSTKRISTELERRPSVKALDRGPLEKLTRKAALLYNIVAL
jgi:hypothetical protein